MLSLGIGKGIKAVRPILGLDEFLPLSCGYNYFEPGLSPHLATLELDF